MASEQKSTPESLRGMLQIARFHREHERYYAMQGIQMAADLRRDANALKMLANRWLEAAALESPEIDYDDPRFKAAGCEDLNDRAAVAATGILFMEGEQEPAEILTLKMKLGGIGMGLAGTSTYLARAMDAAWPREAATLTQGMAEVAYRRHMVLVRTTLTGQKMGVAARLIAAANEALQSIDFRPAGLRKDLSGAAKLLRTAAWLIDAAAALVAEQSADMGFSDPDWTAYIDELESDAGVADGDSADIRLNQQQA